MKKFEFTLQRILDYRQSLLEREKNNLMALVAQRNELEEKIDSLEQRFLDYSNELRLTAEAGTTVFELQQLGVKIEAVQRSIKSCRKSLEELEQQIDQQREVVKEMSQDVSALEKLYEKQREEYDYATRKEEEERIAELISSKIAREQENPDG